MLFIIINYYIKKKDNCFIKMTKLNRIYFTIIFINLIKYINCFNLETRLPIVKYGEENSYFGYSVAEHIIGNKDESDNTKW